MDIVSTRPQGLRVAGRGPLLRLILIGFVLGVVAIPAVRTLAVSPGNQSFLRTWQRPDQPVAGGMVNRTWMWGPEAFTDPLTEPYAESPGGRRTIQYFDKSRMEITRPDADPGADWYVTNGLLVVELITGRMQLGDATFAQHEPAGVNVAGDGDDPTGPTYRSFQPALVAPARETGSAIIERIDRQGHVTEDTSLVTRNVAAAYYAPETKHTVAGPFWTFMNSAGLVYRDGQYLTDTLFLNPFYATGLPVTEAYWANVKLAGTYQDVLMQCFERRCLTYTPGNSDGWQVEAGNVGRHYYTWRYEQLGDDPTATPDPASTPRPSPTPDPSSTPSPSPTPEPDPAIVDYAYTAAWDTQVLGPAALNAPVGIAVDPEYGFVYVAESGEHDVHSFGPNGELLDSWGSLGSSNDQLDRPEGLATDAYGLIYVADFNNNRVQLFHPDGGYLGTVATGARQGLNGPMDVAVHVTPGSTAAGDVYRIFIVDHLNHRIQKRTVTSSNRVTPDAPDYQPLQSIGGQGSGNGQLSLPNGIGMDADGNIFVADTGNHRIQKFSPDGQWLASFGSFGAQPGQFVYPRDVAVSPDGRWIYVVNSGDQNGGAGIKVWEEVVVGGVTSYAFSYEWGATGTEPGQFNYPARIALDADDNVYVTELLNHRVQKFSPIGVLIDVWTDATRGAFGRPVEIEDGGDGNLYVVDNELAQVKAFAADGSGYVYQWSDELQSPVDVAVRAGYAYVADQAQNQILKFTAGGEFIDRWGGPGSGDGQFNNLEGVAVDDGGYVYVIDRGNYRIQKFTAEGQFVTSWGSYGTGPGQFENSKSIAVHGDIVYVVEFFPARVQRFDLDGAYLGEFGGEGDGPGRLSEAYAVTVDAAGYVYVADRGNHRIQKFSADGAYVAMLTPERTEMPEYSSPSGVAVSEDGTLFVVSDLLEGIMAFEPRPAAAF